MKGPRFKGCQAPDYNNKWWQFPQKESNQSSAADRDPPISWLQQKIIISFSFLVITHNHQEVENNPREMQRNHQQSPRGSK